MNQSIINVIPEKVLRAKNLAEQYGFQYSCLDEVGKLLQVLSSSIKQGVIAEIGTGYGVGTSWIASNLSQNVSLISIDNDKSKIEVVSSLFDEENIKFLHGDWKEILKYAPFQLLFADGGKAKEQDPDLLFQSLAVGGMILIDDLTPFEYWPEEWKNQKDRVREYWLNHPKLSAIELRVTERNAVILATKIAE